MQVARPLVACDRTVASSPPSLRDHLHGVTAESPMHRVSRDERFIGDH